MGEWKILFLKLAGQLYLIAFIETDITNERDVGPRRVHKSQACPTVTLHLFNLVLFFKNVN